MRLWALLSLFALMLATPAFSEDPPAFETSWGGTGTGDGQFGSLRDIGVDASGNVYATDAGNDRVQVFTGNGVFLRKWGSPGTGDGQFETADQIAVDSATAKVFVVDRGLFGISPAHVTRFDLLGSFETKWPESWNVQAVEVDRDHNVYIGDASNIRKYDASGNLLDTYGTPGVGPGQFDEIYGVAVDADGNIFVSDWTTHKISKLDDTGTFIKWWGTFGFVPAPGVLNRPDGLDLDSDGNVYVVDNTLSFAQKFDNDGNFISMWGSQGTADGEFNNPRGIAVDNQGSIFIADSYAGNAGRIQKFVPQSLDSLLVDPGSVVFPPSALDETVCDSITIVNRGSNPLTIAGIEGCSSSPFGIDSTMTMHTLAPDESTEIVICVTPTEGGAQTCTLTVYSDAVNSPAIVPVELIGVTAADPISSAKFRIAGMQPNPFTRSTTIRFNLPTGMRVEAEVVAVNGSRVRSLSDGRYFTAGEHKIVWNGLDQQGGTAASGVYFIRLKTDLGIRMSRVVLTR